MLHIENSSYPMAFMAEEQPVEPTPTTVTAVTPPTPAERRLLARDQFAVLGDLLNERTFRYILAFGIRQGWHCWESGAGGASVPSWLADQVGPAGRVVASDIDTSALEDAPNPPFEVRGPDLTVDLFPIVSAWGRKQPDQQIRTSQ